MSIFVVGAHNSISDSLTEQVADLLDLPK